MSADPYLMWAERFDSWRVVPRTVLYGWGFFTAYIVYKTMTWYFNEPAVARGLEESGMATGVITALTGFWYKIYQDYTAKGRDWTSSQ